MKIFKLFPFLEVICNLTGTSISEAQRIKEQNKNEAEVLLQNLQPSEDRLYFTKREILSANGISTSYSQCDNPHTVKDLECLDKVQKLYAESAVLGSSMALIEAARKDITEISIQNLAEKLGITLTFKQPLKKSSIIGTIDYFCNCQKIKELIPLCGIELLNLISKIYKEGLKVEAEAAVLGNQYTKSNSLLRRSSTLMDKKLLDQETAGVIVYTTKVVAIDKESFEKKEKEIAAEYTKLQQARNSIMKQIKDAARELEILNNKEYQAQLSKYNAEVKEFESMVQGIRLELLQELSSLKIAM